MVNDRLCERDAILYSSNDNDLYRTLYLQNYIKVSIFHRLTRKPSAVKSTV